MPNIKLSYLYRDRANYKNHCEIVFANPHNKTREEITAVIQPLLFDGEWFLADKWNVTDLHFEKWDAETDHCFHEFENIELTTESPTDERSIDEWLAQIVA